MIRVTAARFLASVAILAATATSLTGQSGSFGNSVVIDGDEMFVAEPNPTFRSGAVYVYRTAGGQWRESAVLRAPNSERADGFGTVLAKTGGTLFVGQRSGPLHVFERDGDGAWRATGMVEGDGVNGIDPGCGQYGYCGTDFGLTLGASGDWLLVGAPGAAPDARRRRGNEPEEPAVRGAVHAYQRDGDGEWVERATLWPADGTEGDGFGSAIAFTFHGVLIGAPRWNAGAGGATDDLTQATGRVYHFRMVDGRWEEAGALESAPEANANFGSAIAATGDRLMIGAPGTDESRGAVFAHSWDADLTRWVPGDDRLALSDGESGDRFGSAVTFAGGDIWIGAPTPRGNEIGSVYVYEAGSDGSLPIDPRRIQLAQAETVEQDHFGALIVANEAIVAVGAPGMHHQSGSVHLYQRGDDRSPGAVPGTDPAWQDSGTLLSAPDALAPLLGEERRCADGMVGPFDCDDVELLSFIPNSILRAGPRSRGVRTNDNWGWTDPLTGREYALVGRNDGTSFIDITDPSNPVLVGDLPKPWGTPPSQLWRDIKTYKDHAYIVADGAGEHGMQVFDLTRLRGVAADEMPALFEPDTHYTRIASSHNIVINEERRLCLRGRQPRRRRVLRWWPPHDGHQRPEEPAVRRLLRPRARHPRLAVRGLPGARRTVPRPRTLPELEWRLLRDLRRDRQGQPGRSVPCLVPERGVHPSGLAHPRPPLLLPGRRERRDSRQRRDHAHPDLGPERRRGPRPCEGVHGVAARECPQPLPQGRVRIPGELPLRAARARHRGPVEPARGRLLRHVAASGRTGVQRRVEHLPFFESGTVIVTSLQEGLFVLKKRDRPVS